MLGKMIEDKLIERRLSRTEFAKRINRSRSYVYSILERDSVETEDLLKISKVLKFNFFAHLHAKVNHLPPFAEAPTSESQTPKTPAEEKVVFLEQENAHLKKIISLLEEKIEQK